MLNAVDGSEDHLIKVQGLKEPYDIGIAQVGEQIIVDSQIIEVC